ncbi:hypothetical protein RND81_10G066400 [Saponaria officinalis]|uniref:Hexosyltransferase n=1 Tax=Saponaria officinalis TaxID=3572 RepID=A0AAW1HZ66_SAPOF
MNNNSVRIHTKMSLKTTITTTNIVSFAKRLSIYSILFLSILLFFPATETILNTFLDCRTTTTLSTTKKTTSPPTMNPKWFQPISKPFKLEQKQLQIALVNMDGEILEGMNTLHGAQVTQVEFEKVSSNITWRDLYPLWIDEENVNAKQICPNIPIPSDIVKYKGVDVVVAKDVYRLQVSLVAATLAAESGNEEVSVVFVGGGGGCEPMLEMFRCDDLVWKDGEYWVYKPDVNRLKQKVSLPVGACKVATQPYSFEAENPLEKSMTSTLSKANPKPLKEAYVTLLHSSELYVCGAIALAQSILQTNTTKDLVLLADDSISPSSIHGLEAAGWKVKLIQRVRCPSARKGHYNEWNCSKLRIWQLTDYSKVIFIDADFIVLNNIDHLFSYPQLSASEDTMSIFNSGVMIAEPSPCFFDMLMAKRYTLNSYNGGDQGLLNEVFTWWHRITKKISFLKCFMDEKGERKVPNDVYMIHFVGVKPWVCYRDYDCNWDQVDRHIFASDRAHSRWWRVYDALPVELKPYCGLTSYMDANIQNWREIAKNNVSFTDTHWKIDVKDPRKDNLIKQI